MTFVKQSNQSTILTRGHSFKFIILCLNPIKSSILIIKSSQNLARKWRFLGSFSGSIWIMEIELFVWFKPDLEVEKKNCKLTWRHFIILRVQQRILLRPLRPRWSRRGALRWFRLAAATSVRQSPADSAGQQKDEEDEDDDVEDRPVAVRFGDAPVEEDVGHPECVADARARFRVARAVTRAVVLAHHGADLADGRAQDAVILPELLLQNALHILAVHRRLRRSIFRCSRSVEDQHDVVRLVVHPDVSNVQFHVVAEQQQKLLFQLIQLSGEMSTKGRFDLRKCFTSCCVNDDACAVRKTSTRFMISGSSWTFIVTSSVPVNPCSSETVSLYLNVPATISVSCEKRNLRFLINLLNKRRAGQWNRWIWILIQNR